MISSGCCPCCRTDLFVDKQARIHVLYRGIIEDSIRDMIHRVSEDGGNSFTPPLRISNDNWVINGCPHTGPAMAENQTGLHFAWFTGGARKGCYYTQSVDNGKSFMQHDQVSPAGSHPQVISLPGEALALVWDEQVKLNGEFTKRIGLQVRSATGVPAQQAFITPDTATAAYPVIVPLIDQSVMVAYTISKAGKDCIRYQQVRW